jgi:hypothetical protein
MPIYIYTGADCPYNEVGKNPRGPSAILFRNFLFFWGPIEKKSHQNLGNQSAPVYVYIKRINFAMGQNCYALYVLLIKCAYNMHRKKICI